MSRVAIEFKRPAKQHIMCADATLEEEQNRTNNMVNELIVFDFAFVFRGRQSNNKRRACKVLISRSRLQ